MITGSQGEDVILAKGGNDTVEGRGSDDEINGGTGDDRLRDNTAAVDADEILAGRGRDTINVADGDTGEPSPEDPLEPILDEVDCGPGIDTVAGADEADLIDGETCERGENIDPRRRSRQNSFKPPTELTTVAAVEAAVTSPEPTFGPRFFVPIQCAAGQVQVGTS